MFQWDVKLDWLNLCVNYNRQWEYNGRNAIVPALKIKNDNGVTTVHYSSGND